MKKIFIIPIISILVTILLSGCIEKDISGYSYGSFYSNDCGEPKGGFEWGGDYYANLSLKNGIGMLILEFKTGLGDPIEKHDYTILLKKYTSDEMILLVNGKEVILEWIKYDDVWSKWHNHYIASFGINMDGDEKIGKINTNIFPGLIDHYYVELRLPKIN